MNNILIVDDTRDNLRLLSNLLIGQGYDVRPVPNGQRAISSARSRVPDLILLDILMPDMDGYAVCRALKADERTRDVSIIFISALDDTFDKVKAFEMGGVDYITKPFQEAEVLARVSTHLELQRARKNLEAQKLQLETQNVELIEAARLRADVERITIHDLKTPLNAIVGYPELILMSGDLTEEHIQWLQEIEDAGYRMLHMINHSLNLFKMEQGKYDVQPVSVNIVPMLKKITNDMQRLAQHKTLTFAHSLNGQSFCITHPSSGAENFSIQGEDLLCYSMLANLIKNAIEASPEGACVSMALEADQHTAIIRIHNAGAVPEQIRDSFFEKYATFGKDNTGTGLGTYSAKLIAETQGGTISMTSSEQDGTTVAIRLPRDVASPPIRENKGEPQQTGPHAEEAIVPPSPEELAILYDLVEIGDLFELRNAITRLENSDPQYAPFAAHICHLIDSFRIAAIRKVLKQYLAQK